MSEKKSFLDKLISGKGHLIHKIKAMDSTGKWAYYFLLVEPHTERKFLEAMESEAEEINLEDYGKIIASCYGEEPTQEIKDLLKDKYGFDV